MVKPKKLPVAPKVQAFVPHGGKKHPRGAGIGKYMSKELRSRVREEKDNPAYVHDSSSGSGTGSSGSEESEEELMEEESEPIEKKSKSKKSK